MIDHEIRFAGELLQPGKAIHRKLFVGNVVNKESDLAAPTLKESIHAEGVVANGIVFGESWKNDCNLQWLLSSVIKG